MCKPYVLFQMSYRNPNSKDESSPSGLNRREETMKETNDEDKTEQSRPVGHLRRDFIVSAATAVASVGAANLLNLQPAQGANAKNSVGIGNGPCLNGNTQTYGSKDKDGTITQGGYSTFVVVDEDFVINYRFVIDMASLRRDEWSN